MKKPMVLFLLFISTSIINGAAESDKAQFQETVQQHLNEGFALLNPKAIAQAVDKILAEGLLVKHLPKLILDALLFARFLANEGNALGAQTILKSVSDAQWVGAFTFNINGHDYPLTEAIKRAALGQDPFENAQVWF